MRSGVFYFHLGLLVILIILIPTTRYKLTFWIRVIRFRTRKILYSKMPTLAPSTHKYV